MGAAFQGGTSDLQILLLPIVAGILMDSSPISAGASLMRSWAESMVMCRCSPTEIVLRLPYSPDRRTRVDLDSPLTSLARKATTNTCDHGGTETRAEPVSQAVNGSRPAFQSLVKPWPNRTGLRNPRKTTSSSIFNTPVRSPMPPGVSARP